MGSSDNLATHFSASGEQALRCSAPGRVNLIGEHTDYSGGFVMPAAIDFRTLATIRPRVDARILITSQNMGEEVEYSAAALPAAARKHWSDYPMGVAWSLAKESLPVRGFELSLEGNVPLGAGLSSSASIEVATAFALLELAGASLPLAPAGAARRTPRSAL